MRPTLLALILGGLTLAAGCRPMQDLGSFPKMPASYEAKEMCSCLFVEARPLDVCEAWVRQDVVKSQGHTVDVEHQTVTAKALGATATARWLGEREGCVLDPTP